MRPVVVDTNVDKPLRRVPAAAHGPRQQLVSVEIQSSATGMHSPCHLGLGKPFVFHRSFNLSRQNTLNRGRGDFFMDALLAQPAIDGRSNILFPHLPSRFIRFSARSMSCCGQQQHHAFFHDAENIPCDLPTGQIAADLPQFASKRTNERHANRPLKNSTSLISSPTTFQSSGRASATRVRAHVHCWRCRSARQTLETRDAPVQAKPSKAQRLLLIAQSPASLSKWQSLFQTSLS